MTLYLVGFSDRLTQYTDVVRAVLRDRGGTELWKDVWAVELDERPDAALFHFTATEAAFAIPISGPGAFFSVGRAAGPTAQTYFAEKIAPLLIEPDETGEVLAHVSYCNDGEKALGKQSPAIGRLASLPRRRPRCAA